ncbi:hypothetical protein GOODEAATRI_007035 [Goodea atripinnis]|uniref:Golgi-associated, gamma adaptin ear containing, ARF binding protein 1 n=1 Tax=Goodea atripinnis TaxID=208336 RepID=A0ABV0NVU2_9TELE
MESRNDQKRVEKVSKRVNAIQEVKESVSLLSQLLEGYSKESCSHSNQELIKDLYQRCEKMRPTLFRLASDTEDNDEALADILEANDSLTQVINLYRQLIKGEEMSKDAAAPPSQQDSKSGGSSSALLDLTGLNVSEKTEPFNPLAAPQNLGLSLLDDELMSLDLQAKSEVSCRPAPAPASRPTSSLLVQSEQADGVLVSSLGIADRSSSSAADPCDSISLAGVTVPLESIKPSSVLPVTVFDKHSLRVLFTFARDCPPSRPDVLVVIISMLSSAPIPVTNIRFQAAVPREKVRLRYKLTFNLGDKSHDESGDVYEFPPPDTWGNL